MTRRDYRCAFSGVSLLDREVAVVLLEQAEESWRPVGLPLFGVYEGMGTVADVNDGPNADLILAAVQKAIEERRVVVDFEAMGLEEQPIDHIETLLGLLACSQIQGDGAARTSEGALGFALLSAHVAAALTENEPDIAQAVLIEELPEHIFDSAFGREIYAPLRYQPHRLRCRFGLSLVGLGALDAQMRARKKAWVPPGEGIDLAESEVAVWLAQAMVELGSDESLVDALEEYAGHDDEPPEAL